MVARALPQRELVANRRDTVDVGQPFDSPRRRRTRVLRRLGRAVSTCVWYLLVLAPMRSPGMRSPGMRPRSASVPAWRRVVARLALAVVAVSSVAMPGGPVGFAATVRVFNAVRLAPVTAPAVLWGLAHGGRLGWRHGMAVVLGMNAGSGPREGVTIGSVYLTGSSREMITARMVRHERRHLTQWSAFGLLFPPLYWSAGQLGQLAGLGDGGAGNVFEIAAGLRAGGYVAPGAVHLERGGPGWRTDLIRWLDPHSGNRAPTEPANQSAVTSPTWYAVDPKKIHFLRSGEAGEGLAVVVGDHVVEGGVAA